MRLALTLLLIVLLLLVPLIWRFSGRKELMKMDLVQFIYAFVLAPAIFIWIKTALFFNLRRELGVSVNDTFWIDTTLTIIALYIYSFVVIHSLTKSFQIQKAKDPLFDVFEHSEYFHLWLSHLTVYSGALLIMLFLGVLNLFLPVTLISSKLALYIGIIIGTLCGFMLYFGIWVNRIERQKSFDRIMKFQVYIYTFIVLIGYLIADPKFGASYTAFWGSVFFFVTATVSLQFLKRPKFKVRRFHPARQVLVNNPTNIPAESMTSTLVDEGEKSTPY